MSDPVFTLERGTTPLLLSLPHVGTGDRRRRRARARAARARARGHRLAPRRGLRLRARARRERARAALLALRRSTSTGRPRTRRCIPARTTPSSCRRASSAATRSIAKAAFPTSARSRGGVDVYWRPYHDALAAELARLVAAHGHAVLWDGHSIQAEVPWLFEGRLPDLNLGTAGGASCAPTLRAALMAVLAAQIALQPRHRRPLQGRLHHAPLRPARASACTRSSSRWAWRRTWTRRARRCRSHRSTATGWRACSRCCARCCRRRSTGEPDGR